MAILVTCDHCEKSEQEGRDAHLKTDCMYDYKISTYRLLLVQTGEILSDKELFSTDLCKRCCDSKIRTLIGIAGRLET